MKKIKMQQSGFPGILLIAMTTLFVFSSCNQQDSASQASQTATAKTATASATPVSMTLSGEVLDMSCYMKDGSMGMGHQSCAQGCLNKGLPAGILNKANGQVYLLIEDHDNAEAYKAALQHAAQNVEITGTAINKNGVQSVVVESVKGI